MNNQQEYERELVRVARLGYSDGVKGVAHNPNKFSPLFQKHYDYHYETGVMVKNLENK